MNSVGGGGDETPHLVDAANALTFCLMVLTCYFSSAITKLIGIRLTLILGTIGYCPYAAGLYLNNRYGHDWLLLLGAALCGLSAGIFWATEAAIAIAYPEPYNRGRFLGLWLSFRVGGQIIGGAINLGVNAHRAVAGKVSYHVFEAFIALQALAPFAGLLLSQPWHVQRTDGRKVDLKIHDSIVGELKKTAKLFFSKKFLLIIPFIAQAVYGEAVFFTYEGDWFSVRARGLGSFLSGVVAAISGLILGTYLDSKRFSLKSKSRYAWAVIVTLQGGWWIWGTVITTEYRRTLPVLDWSDAGFGRGFALFIFWIIGFQLNYMFLYFIVGNISDDEEEIIRITALLRGTESAVQAVSYGLSSITVFGQVGGTYLNFALWGIALLPTWHIIKHIGTKYDYDRDKEIVSTSEDEAEADDDGEKISATNEVSVPVHT
ncbi:DEKNAAC104770 [Brettanomyces naardenensis]|uniref:DEKNAAC104770 n=1 Tax=Brettanomyces naardenensis TaxID=13370 RepID=A0A448YRS0_BRENA|nr:DEKNAAC104770 [Brettanomyces naardenensis]